MIWHIFKKDWRLLWPMASGVMLLNLIQRIVHSHINAFRNDYFGSLYHISGWLDPLTSWPREFLS